MILKRIVWKLGKFFVCKPLTRINFCGKYKCFVVKHCSFQVNCCNNFTTVNKSEVIWKLNLQFDRSNKIFEYIHNFISNNYTSQHIFWNKSVVSVRKSMKYSHTHFLTLFLEILFLRNVDFLFTEVMV